MSYTPKVYRKQGGAEMVVASGGAVTVEAGGALRVAASTLVPSIAVTNIANAGAGTYSAEAIAGGLITRDPNGAGRTDTTATAAAIIAACNLTADGDTVKCYVVNTADAAEVITLAGGDGVTISNVGQTVAQNESAVLLFRRASSTTVTLYVFGA